MISDRITTGHRTTRGNVVRSCQCALDTQFVYMKVFKLAIAVVGFCALPLQGQQPHAPAAPACIQALVPIDTARVIYEVHAEEHHVWRNTKPVGLPIDFLTSVAAATAWNMTLPDTAQSNVFQFEAPPKPARGTVWPSTNSSVIFTLRRDGGIADLYAVVPGTSTAMEQALSRAVVRAHTAGEIPPLSSVPGDGDATLELSIVARFHDGLRPDTLAELPPHKGASRRVPVGFGRVVRYPLSQEVSAHPRTQQVPIPDDAWGMTIADTVELEFLVDDTGRVSAETSRLLTAHYQEFARAVVEHLPKMRFKPAKSGGCAVATIVAQGFVFGTVRIR